MRLAIYGLGYVGVVTAACLARDGHEVLGVDVNADKVELVNAGRSPIVEKGVPELLSTAVAEGRVSATTDARKALEWADVALVSVGTPSTPQGAADLRHVTAVLDQIADAAIDGERAVVVVLRSTVPPGTLDECERALSARLGRVPVHLAFNPEFLREGSAVQDFEEPPYTIIGTTDPVAERVVRELYANVDAPVHVTSPGTAEMIKYAANAWHATKISFANEIGRLAKAQGVDGRDVMALLTQDHKLNVSPAYMRPGFAYGGSCLPKDVAALLHLGHHQGIDTPLLAALPATNTIQVDGAVEAVLTTGARRVAVLGLAFKPGTDDLRESPAVRLVKRLIGEGCTVRIHDPAVNDARLFGTNLEYIRRNLHHFEALLVDDVEAALRDAEAAVLIHPTAEVRTVAERRLSTLPLIDVAGALQGQRSEDGYAALGW